LLPSDHFRDDFLTVLLCALKIVEAMQEGQKPGSRLPVMALEMVCSVV